MPALLPTPVGVVRVRMGVTRDSKGPYYAGFDYGYTGAGLTTSQLSSIAGAAATAWNTDLAALVSTDYTLVSVIAVDLQNPSTPEGVVAVSHAGTRSGSALDDSACVSIAFLPNRRYRGARPKCFLTAGTNSELASGQAWTGTFVTAVNTAWAAFIAAFLAGAPGGVTLTVQKAVFRTGPPYTVTSNAGKTRSHSTGTPLNPPLVTDIVAIAAATKIGSQRKRLGKPF